MVRPVRVPVRSGVIPCWQQRSTSKNSPSRQRWTTPRPPNSSRWSASATRSRPSCSQRRLGVHAGGVAADVPGSAVRAKADLRGPDRRAPGGARHPAVVDRGRDGLVMGVRRGARRVSPPRDRHRTVRLGRKTGAGRPAGRSCSRRRCTRPHRAAPGCRHRRASASARRRPRSALPDPPRLPAGADRADQFPRPARPGGGAERRHAISCSSSFAAISAACTGPGSTPHGMDLRSDPAADPDEHRRAVRRPGIARRTVDRGPDRHPRCRDGGRRADGADGRRPTRTDRPAGRVQRTEPARQPIPPGAATGHPGARRAPRTPAGHAAEGRESARAAGRWVGSVAGLHVQRRGEPAHAERERSDRVPSGRSCRCWRKDR